MRRVFYSLVSILCMVLIVTSCQKENLFQVNQKGQLELGFKLKQPNLKHFDEIIKSSAEAASIIVSIADVYGNLVYDTEEIVLYNINGYYLSKPISLPEGSYDLIKFFVIDKYENVIYAAPLKGSKNAYLVDALPLNIIISADQVTTTTPEVLSTKQFTPEDFGFSTFSFEVVETFDFLVDVFIFNEIDQEFELTTAQIIIIHNDVALYVDSLSAITNKITLRDDIDSCWVKITKSGYHKFKAFFAVSDLKQYYSSTTGGPLEVVLKPIVDENVIRMVTDQSDLQQINIQIRTDSEVVIDWGDGEINHVSPGVAHQLAYNYSDPGQYSIRISGRVEDISFFTVLSSRLTFLDISRAINLNGFSCPDNMLSSLDVSNNLNLSFLGCFGNNLTSLDILNHFNLTNLVIGYQGMGNDFSSDEMNRIIGALLQNVEGNPREGVLYTSGNDPFTGQGLIDLNILQNDYNWQIDPFLPSGK